jgi:hypothetical protein
MPTPSPEELSGSAIERPLRGGVQEREASALTARQTAWLVNLSGASPCSAPGIFLPIKPANRKPGPKSRRPEAT